MNIHDFLAQYRPAFSPPDGAGGGDTPPASDTPPVGDTPPAGDTPPPSDGTKWFEDKRWDDKTQKYLSERGLNQIDDPLEAFQKTIKDHRATLSLGRNPDDFLAKPKDGQTTVEWMKENNLLTLPEAPDGYEITQPEMPDGVEYDTAAEKQLRDLAHQQGLSGEAVQGLVNLQTKITGDLMADAQQTYAAENQKMLDNLTTDWGDQTKGRMARAGQTMTVIAEKAGLGVDEIQLMSQAFKQGGAQDASTVRMFDAIAEMMGDDTAVGLGQSSNNFGDTPQVARQKLDKMNAPGGEFYEATKSGNRAEMKRLEPQMDALRKQATQGK
ncbi:MAG: hypothetical protein JKY93_03605 [Gammaproteobacteria bacterium]|nr:hypothetical protein [Gammaproteobacteria bacterium]